jgi:PAS domain-containing protein
MIEDHGDVGFWTRDFEARTNVYSVGASRLLGIGFDMPVENICLTELLHPDDRSMHEEAQSNLKRGQSMNIDVRLARPDGSVKWLNLRAGVLRDSKDKPVQAVGTVRDVTELHDLKEAVLHGRRRQSVLAGISGGMEWGFDGSGSLLYSQRWHSMTAQLSVASAHLGWIDMVHPRAQNEVRRAWQDAVRNRTDLTMEVPLLMRDGECRVFEFRASPIIERDGDATEWIGVMVPSHAEPRHSSPSSITSSHIRAARALLDWTHADLAQAARISVSSVRRVEADIGASRPATLASIIKALEIQGIVFDAQKNGSLAVRWHPVPLAESLTTGSERR